MQTEGFTPLDPERMLFGQEPASFLLEVVVRGLVLYALLLLAARVMGRRMTSQLSLVELTVILTLGAIVSAPLELPNRGIIAGVVALATLVAYHRGVAWLSFRSGTFERWTQGKAHVVVRDGVIDVAALVRTDYSRERLFSVLRSQGVEQLGEVKRVYIEAHGELSVYRCEPVVEGLSVRTAQEGFPREHGTTNWACRSCGATKSRDSAARTCPACGHDEWSNAVLPRRGDESA